MAIDVTADLPELLADFGVTVTVGAGTAATTFTGIFQNEYEAQSVYGFDIDSSRPVLTVRTADVSTMTTESTMSISSTTYYVLSRQDDGTGLSTLILGRD